MLNHRKSYIHMGYHVDVYFTLPRRILVMGGTRFIGCYLVAKLREMGHTVVPRWSKKGRFLSSYNSCNDC